MQDAAGEHDTDDEFITVTSDSLGDILHGLPFLLRKTLSIAAQLPVGTLDLTLPEGRRLRFAGAKAGPRARLVIHDTTCLRRFLIAGDVGFAEGYLQKEWDSPDLRAL